MEISAALWVLWLAIDFFYIVV